MTTTTSDIIKTIRELAKEQPDKRAICFNVIDGEPVCIVGHAIFRLGLNTVLDELKGDGWHGHSAWSVIRNLENFGEMPLGSLDSLESEWIIYVQKQQDSYLTWAEAVESADGFYQKVAADV